MISVNKPLIAICTCHRFRGRADAQRATWVKKIKDIDYKFFLGGSNGIPGIDEVFLDVPDDYDSLPLKTQAIMKWALDHGYDAVFKCDDDTYVFPDRLLTILPTTAYEGRINGSNVQLAPKGWCSGFAYWLAGEAISIIANAGKPTHRAEDLWVGMILNAKGIHPKTQSHFKVLSTLSSTQWYSMKNQIIAACEFREGQMIQFEQAINDPQSMHIKHRGPMMNSRIGKRVAVFGEVLRRRR